MCVCVCVCVCVFLPYLLESIVRSIYTQFIQCTLLIDAPRALVRPTTRHTARRNTKVGSRSLFLLPLLAPSSRYLFLFSPLIKTHPTPPAPHPRHTLATRTPHNPHNSRVPAVYIPHEPHTPRTFTTTTTPLRDDTRPLHHYGQTDRTVNPLPLATSPLVYLRRAYRP